MTHTYFNLCPLARPLAARAFPYCRSSAPALQSNCATTFAHGERAR